MFKKIPYISSLVLLFFIPLLSKACGVPVAEKSFNIIFNSLTLWLAVAIGIIATTSVFWDAKQFKGGKLEKVYLYFGSGMFFLLAGMVILIIRPWDIDLVLFRLRDVFYIIGFLLITIGAKKIIGIFKK